MVNIAPQPGPRQNNCRHRTSLAIAPTPHDSTAACEQWSVGAAAWIGIRGHERMGRTDWEET